MILLREQQQLLLLLLSASELVCDDCCTCSRVSLSHKYGCNNDSRRTRPLTSPECCRPVSPPLLLYLLRDSLSLSVISKWTLATHIMIDWRRSRSGRSLDDDVDVDDTDVSRNQKSVAKHPPKSLHALISKLVWMMEEEEGRE